MGLRDLIPSSGLITRSRSALRFQTCAPSLKRVPTSFSKAGIIGVCAPPLAICTMLMEVFRDENGLLNIPAEPDFIQAIHKYEIKVWTAFLASQCLLMTRQFVKNWLADFPKWRTGLSS